jgi:hypothetical protein
MDINNLIKRITPLYNDYKQNSKSIAANNAVMIMWDIGNILKEYLDQNDVAPHNLYREVYGNSEGGSNVSRKSWITREFQSRCYRIRNMFETKDLIQKDFPSLVGFTAFRECMPFLDNKKYKLHGDERQNLLNLLNSNNSKGFVLKEIRKIQANKIGIKNSRNQRLVDLENEKQVFIDFYNYIFHLGKEDSEQISQTFSDNLISKKLIKDIANNTSALSSDGLKFFDFDDKDINMMTFNSDEDQIWINFINVLKDFMDQANPKKIRRFRRLIPPERIVKLADMLNQFNLK